jgi:hypothetical protein
VIRAEIRCLMRYFQCKMQMRKIWSVSSAVIVRSNLAVFLSNGWCFSSIPSMTRSSAFAFCIEHAFDAQDYPLEDLLQKVEVQRDTSRNPLFDASGYVRSASVFTKTPMTFARSACDRPATGEPTMMSCCPLSFERKAFEGDKLVFSLTGEQTSALRSLAKQTDSTMYMVLLASYSAFLSKLSGQHDIIVGSPVAGRSHAILRVKCM